MDDNKKIRRSNDDEIVYYLFQCTLIFRLITSAGGVVLMSCFYPGTSTGEGGQG